MCPQQIELYLHLAVVADFVGTGREMPVPEERPLLLQWLFGEQHAFRPPVRDARVSSELARSQKKKRSTTGCNRRGPAGLTLTPIAQPVLAASRVAAGLVAGKSRNVGS